MVFKPGKSGNPNGRPVGTGKLDKAMIGKDLSSQMKEAFQQTGGITRLIKFANRSDSNYRKFLELFIKLQSTIEAKDKEKDMPIVNFHFNTEEVNKTLDVTPAPPKITFDEKEEKNQS